MSDIEFDFSSEIDVRELEAIEVAAIEKSKLPKPNAKQRSLTFSNQGIGVGGKVGPGESSGGGEIDARCTKRWDGRRKKGKERVRYDDDDDPEDIDEEEEDPTLPPYDPTIPFTHSASPSTTSTFIHPTHKTYESRSYQLNILKKCLFTNTLVSLPTGLGKTFIAASVMLNFHRWFPTGLILFLAPTKPLVNQQIEACLNIAGIPSTDCVILTGSSSKPLRTSIYASQRSPPHTPRIVFATPQTIENDLKSGILDAKQVVCLVVDEAHRATGGYAYVGVVERLMIGNGGKFRVLALTATPGNQFDKVQEVVDGLHIGNIEVRTEESMDLRPYIHNKVVELKKITLPPQITSLRDQIFKLLQPKIEQLYNRGVMDYRPELLTINPFIFTLKMKTPGKKEPWVFAVLKMCGTMSRWIALLLEESVKSFEESLRTLENHQQISKNEIYQSLICDTASLISSNYHHPKMVELKSILLQHFCSEGDQQGNGTKVMVFANFRDVVEEIVEFLNEERPMIRSNIFIGQGNDKKGKKGFTQKEQLAVIEKFKQGEFNTLVATSIGEEGLDIGEVDLIVCYEAQKSPIRMLQRVGRTGRKRSGKIIVLMTEGREEKNWHKAKDAYSSVQSAIQKGKVFELYSDCERLVPGSKCIQEDRLIEVEEKTVDDVREVGKKGKEASKGKQKSVGKKKSTSLGGEKSGFRSVKEMLEGDKGKKAGKKNKVSSTIGNILGGITLSQAQELRSSTRWKTSPFSHFSSTSFAPILPSRQTFTPLSINPSTRSFQLRSTLRSMEGEKLENWMKEMGDALDVGLLKLWSERESEERRIRVPIERKREKEEDFGVDLDELIELDWKREESDEVEGEVSKKTKRRNVQEEDIDLDEEEKKMLEESEEERKREKVLKKSNKGKEKEVFKNDSMGKRDKKEAKIDLDLELEDDEELMRKRREKNKHKSISTKLSNETSQADGASSFADLGIRDSETSKSANLTLVDANKPLKPDTQLIPSISTSKLATSAILNGAQARKSATPSNPSSPPVTSKDEKKRRSDGEDDREVKKKKLDQTKIEEKPTGKIIDLDESPALVSGKVMNLTVSSKEASFSIPSSPKYSRIAPPTPPEVRLATNSSPSPLSPLTNSPIINKGPVISLAKVRKSPDPDFDDLERNEEESFSLMDRILNAGNLEKDKRQETDIGWRNPMDTLATRIPSRASSQHYEQIRSRSRSPVRGLFQDNSQRLRKFRSRSPRALQLENLPKDSQTVDVPVFAPSLKLSSQILASPSPPRSSNKQATSQILAPDSPPKRTPKSKRSFSISEPSHPEKASRPLDEYDFDENDDDEFLFTDYQQKPLAPKAVPSTNKEDNTTYEFDDYSFGLEELEVLERFESQSTYKQLLDPSSMPPPKPSQSQKLSKNFKNAPEPSKPPEHKPMSGKYPKFRPFGSASSKTTEMLPPPLPSVIPIASTSSKLLDNPNDEAGSVYMSFDATQPVIFHPRRRNENALRTIPEDLDESPIGPRKRKLIRGGRHDDSAEELQPQKPRIEKKLSAKEIEEKRQRKLERLVEKKSKRKGLEKGWMDVEALDSDQERRLVNGEELDSDDEDSEDDAERSSDREFIASDTTGDISTTIYRQSLLSQFPSNNPNGPRFKNPIVRPGAFLLNANSRRPVLLSSPMEEPDSYSLDSFCVADDDVEEVEESDEDL